MKMKKDLVSFKIYNYLKICQENVRKIKKKKKKNERKHKSKTYIRKHK